MQGYIKGGIVGGIILFLWGAFSWMVLPWHAATLYGFQDEQAVATAITTNATQPGMYILPTQMSEQDNMADKPFVFAAVKLKGMSHSMALPMLIGLISQIIAAILVSWMLSKTVGLTYAGRVVYVLIFAIAASVAIHITYWNWLGFATDFTMVEIADLLISWLLAGLVIAKFSHQAIRF